MKNRIEEWDFIKGFLLTMVMLGHTTASFGEYDKTPLLEYFSSLTVSFIMPLFLMTTGYFIYSEQNAQNAQNSYVQFFTKKWRRLIIPAVLGGGMRISTCKH